MTAPPDPTATSGRRHARRLATTALCAALVAGAVVVAGGPRADAMPTTTDVRTVKVQNVRLRRGVQSLRVQWNRVKVVAPTYRVQVRPKGRRWRTVTVRGTTTVEVRRLPATPTEVRVRAVKPGARGRWSNVQVMTPTSRSWVNRRFTTRPPGAPLPTGPACEKRVRPARETRTANTRFNRTEGSDRHDRFPRVSGQFTGTTDEIIQWAACKWGVHENLVRSMAAVESWWDQRARGDFTGKKRWCDTSLRGSVPCPGSVGLMQIFYRFHADAYEDRNVIRSSAYNLDYAMQFWRGCYEGDYGWLDDYPRGRRYRAGDALGCAGMYNAGRWYTTAAKSYMARVQDARRARVWELPQFGDAALVTSMAAEMTDLTGPPLGP